MDERGRRQLSRWVVAGLLTDTQADAIEAWEDGRLGVRPRHGVAAEVLGDAGVVVVASAASLVVAQYWADVESWARLLLVATATALVAAGAAWLTDADDPPIRRLAAFLWFAATGGLALSLALLTGDVLSFAGQNQLLVSGTVVAATSGALLWWRRAPLLHVACLGGVVAAALGLVDQYDHASADVQGAVVWGVGACWTVLAAGLLVPPARLGLALGPTVAFVGAQLVVDDSGWGGRALGLASAVAVLAGAVALRSVVLAGAGVPALFVFGAQAIAAMTQRQGAPEGGRLSIVLGVLVAGLALLGAALAMARKVGLRAG